MLRVRRSLPGHIVLPYVVGFHVFAIFGCLVRRRLYYKAMLDVKLWQIDYMISIAPPTPLRITSPESGLTTSQPQNIALHSATALTDVLKYIFSQCTSSARLRGDDRAALKDTPDAVGYGRIAQRPFPPVDAIHESDHGGLAIARPIMSCAWSTTHLYDKASTKPRYWAFVTSRINRSSGQSFRCVLYLQKHELACCRYSDQKKSADITASLFIPAPVHTASTMAININNCSVGEGRLSDTVLVQATDPHHGGPGM